MALLGSFIDVRKQMWHVNRKSFTFKHGLPRQPDFITIHPLGTNGIYMWFSFEFDKHKVKIYRSFYGVKKCRVKNCRVVIKIVSIVTKCIIK